MPYLARICRSVVHPNLRTLDVRQRCTPRLGMGDYERTCLLQGISNVGPHHAGHRIWLLRPSCRLRLRVQSALRGIPMIFDYALAGLVTAGLLFYLTYALLRPERF
jgi:K+-transporting ATPase KdpF subunit